MIELEPTGESTFRIICSNRAADPGKAIELSRRQEAEGEIEQACNTRFEAVQRLMDAIPDEDDVELDWGDTTSRNALLLIHLSAIDHFLIGDFEMCAAMLELLLELDPEDHFEASKQLAYSYVALEEYELFDEVINDVGDKDADKSILKLWSEFRRTGRLHEGEMIHFRTHFPVYAAEFVAADHPVDDAYLKGIEADRPSREALARELWLQTEHLWSLFPDFIEALKAAV